jgi:uncharacterized protein (TIGR02996 family)
MTDRDALLSAVLEHPADDTARLVLADFLRERSDPSDVALGRFLWAGVVASRYRDADVIEEAEYYAALAELTAVASEGWPARWLAALGPGPAPVTADNWGWDSTADRVTVRLGTVGAEYGRGMLTGLTLGEAEWIAVARAALATWPVELVTVSDVSGLTLRIEAPSDARWGWRLRGELRLPGRRVPLVGGVVAAALSPFPGLVEPATTLRVEWPFPNRAALSAAADTASLDMFASLRDQAGDRWPPPVAPSPRLLR